MKRKIFVLLFLIGNVSIVCGKNSSYMDSLRSLVGESENDTIKFNALIIISEEYAENYPDIAYSYALKSLTLATKINEPQKIGNAHNTLGDVYWYKGDYGSSAEHYLKALKIFENIGDKVTVASCYRNVGWVYKEQKNYFEAFNYFKNALAINSELNRKKELGQNYNDIAIVYAEQLKFDDAINNYCKALEIDEEIGSLQGIAAVYGNLSDMYAKMGAFTQAIENAQASLKVSKEIGNKRYLCSSFMNLGMFYIEISNYSEALSALQNAEKYAIEINDNLFLASIFKNYALLFSKQQNFKKAYECELKALAFKDSLYEESNNKQAVELTAQYESEKKELTISNLEKEKKLSEEKFKRERSFKIYIAIFCLLAGVFLFVLFRNNLRKRKANNVLELTYHEIEEKNKEITDSIYYSKRIQDASLPVKELKYELFGEIFIFFQPKDIVSGDFYWYTEKNGKKIIACCDCTGHGVPGALMSMLGNNFLNQIVNEKNITSANEILNLLHKEVRRALKQGVQQMSSKDGMDMALIVFNSETEMEYAGAQRPLWIIRNDEGILIEIKADKFSIGGDQTESERKFTKQTISLLKGDCMYIFSDGLVDQFGGADGKKFMTKQFKNWLIENHKLPMIEQGAKLESYFYKWKGNYEQVDDISVIGIRI